MGRFAAFAGHVVVGLVPAYARHLEPGRTSFRPVEITGRMSSNLKDDARLHVDAFPSQPLAGRRILRVFANINPDAKPRHWLMGEPFETMAARFLPQVRRYSPLQAHLLAAVGITRRRRTAYDHLMLGLHDAAKRDDRYQAAAPQRAIAFPAGSTWVCFTDRVMHAALAGQFALEQTFYLDPAALTAPALAPLEVLRQMTSRNLI
jgi:hypothetical protein